MISPRAGVYSRAPGGGERSPADVTRLGLLLLGFAAVVAGSAAGGDVALGCAFLAIVLAAVGLVGARLLEWRFLLALVLLVVFLVPARRIVVAVSLPIDPEPYRLLAIVVFGLWLVALLADPRVRLRQTHFDSPLALLFVAVLMSEIANPGLVNLYSSNVVKALFLILSVLLLYYFVASVFDTRADVEFVLRVLVLGSTFVAIAGLVEARTAYNVFSNLDRLPELAYVSGLVDENGVSRGGLSRVLASAEHPLALGALFAMVIPMSIYLARRSRLWLVSTAFLLAGVAVTVSRTPIVMLVVAGLVVVRLRPRAALKFLPLLPVALAVLYLAVPNAFDTTIRAFFPRGGLLEEQSTDLNQGGSSTIGRLGDLGPALDDFGKRPLFGAGHGTRVYTPENTAGYLPDGRYNGILDNQWLGSLLDIGVIGVAALLWLFAASYRMLAREARARDDDDGWLAVAFAASFLAFAVGMLFLDAFAFTQVTVVFFVMLAIAGVFLRTVGRMPEAAPAARLADLVAATERHRRRVAEQLQRVRAYSAGNRPPDQR